MGPNTYYLALESYYVELIQNLLKEQFLFLFNFFLFYEKMKYCKIFTHGNFFPPRNVVIGCEKKTL